MSELNPPIKKLEHGEGGKGWRGQQAGKMLKAAADGQYTYKDDKRQTY